MKTNRIIIALILCFSIYSCGAQKKEFDPEYVKVTNDRAQKIVDGMNLNSAEKKREVRDLIAEQYRNLSWIQDGRDAKIEEIRQSKMEESRKEEKIKKLESKADEDIADLHEEYLNDLHDGLTPEQVVAVKDGMTYGVVPNTYGNYLDMLPQLTRKQKDFIHKNLVEAREHAMDAGSSDQKHWWFNEYKGRITNYLAAEGYNLKEAEEEWLKRIEEKR
ncbi:DUF3826 domain-containing protein [Autumnicola musiva]|uniref:DUF3826 domain-containing protein n=1 Tax=Autumnicola musiva TaxID=3075589 RepID=A0ABU3D7R0_9FLAO|nr:DUF3826 domain-containing protein [Zunongwangia sp. F117]MDT0677575.1 DUF3826 domain-containing protein [Zunongwangia sp. F117]